MKRAKTLLAILLSVGMLLSCTACGGATQPQEEPFAQPSTPTQPETDAAVIQLEQLLAEGHYEAAYALLSTWDEEKAKAWETKLLYLPLEVVPEDISDSERKTYTYQDGLLTGILYESEFKAYTYTYTWDDNHRLIRKEVSFDYDPGAITVGEDGTFVYRGGKDVQETRTYTYNEQGALVKKVSEWMDTMRETRDYLYNENGDLYKEKFTQKETGKDPVTFITEYVYTYDEAGRKTSEQAKDITGTFTWQYGADGRITEYGYTEGTVTLRDATTYHEGKPTEKIYVDSDGETHTTRYVYDEAGLLVLEEYTSTVNAATTTTYTYDEHHRLVGYSTKEGEREIEAEAYTYDEAGRRLSTKRKYYHDGHEAYFTTEQHHTFNAQGQPLTYKRKDRNNVWYEYVYTYDTTVLPKEHPLYGLGRITGETMTNDFDGSGEMTYVYEGDATGYKGDHHGYRAMTDRYDYGDADGTEYHRSEKAVLYYYPEGMPEWMAAELGLVDPEVDPMKWLAEELVYLEE